METRANYALIGAFTLSVIALAFGFVFWFSGPSKAARRTPLDIIFSGSVSGLSRGGGVSFNGLRVGDVKELELNPNNPSEVIARVEVNRLTPIKTDTRARLEYAGLTGVATVALSGGSAEAQPLLPVDYQSVPKIHADASQFQDLVETAQRLGGKISALTEKASKILDENSENIAALVLNLVELTKNANAVVAAIQPEKVELAVADAQKAIARLDAVLAGLDAILAANKDQIGTLVGDFSEAARSIKKTSDNLDARLKEVAANLARFSGSGLKQYEALAVDGRKTLNDISRAVRQLEKDPSQVIFGGKPKLPEYNGP